MENEILQIPAQITDVNLKGKNIRIKVETIQELTPEDELILLQVRNKVGYFVFKPEKFIEEDIISLPEKYDLEAGEKTPSQRLRAVLYVFWKQKRKEKGVDFNSFYKEQMSRFIESVKEKLEPTDEEADDIKHLPAGYKV
jgi:hypothetical protein